MLLVSILFLWRHEFNPKSVHIIFVVDKVALDQIFVAGLQFAPVFHQCSLLISILIFLLPEEQRGEA